MENVAVILAGGHGERFWPKSRRAMPKQFLPLFGSDTLLQNTAARLLRLFRRENIFVVSNKDFSQLAKAQLADDARFDIPAENFIFEPVPRNTAPAIALASLFVKKRFGDALIGVFPADHLIQNEDNYISDLKKAFEFAVDTDSISTIGIKPFYPETGFGYIQFDGKCPNRVLRFKEKPDLATAKKYLESGDFLWNSGQFFFRASTVLKAMERFSLASFDALKKIEAAIGAADAEAAIAKNFPNCENVSFDVAVAEKCEKMFVVPSSFEWSDVGSWFALAHLRCDAGDCDADGNVFSGDSVVVDAKNCFADCGKKLVALVGVENLVVVDSDDALLICEKSRTQDVKKAIEKLKEENKEIYL